MGSVLVSLDAVGKRYAERRVLEGITLAGAPDLLLLDEPTASRAPKPRPCRVLDAQRPELDKPPVGT